MRPRSSGDRASASGAEGRRFESCRGHHQKPRLTCSSANRLGVSRPADCLSVTRMSELPPNPVQQHAGHPPGVSGNKPAGKCNLAARATEVCHRAVLGLSRKLSHSPGVHRFICEKRGTIWFLDGDDDFADRSAVTGAVADGRLLGVGLFGLLRRLARSSVKRRVGDSAPELLIGVGGRRGDDHRGAELAAAALAARSPLVIIRPLPSGKQTELSPLLSQHSLPGGTANPHY
jgi:hypothetical protein